MPTRQAALEKRRRGDAALAMRLAGATFEEITAAMGFASPKYTQTVIERALASTVTPDQRENMRDIQGRRIERLLRGVWPKAIDGTSAEHLTATRMAKDLIDRYCKLYGLDEPVEVLVHTPTTVELENWVAAVMTAGDVIDVTEHNVIEGAVIEENADAS